MAESFEDPAALVPQDLSPADSRRYEELTVESLRQAMMDGAAALVAIDSIDLVGARPDTLVVFRYHYQSDYVGRDPALVARPRAEIAKLWKHAIDPDDLYSQGMMDGPALLAADIGSAYDAAELTLADPDTLTPIGVPPRISPRLYEIRRPLPP